ncbi:mannopine transport system permease protein (plasmid) [Shinella sp. WSC3-e]|nr:ABC transporter permease [Rhizobiaceae bacterium]CAK7262140.1 mannopine transport system permease protein [Shinella sp. WSC3-e]
MSTNQSTRRAIAGELGLHREPVLEALYPRLIRLVGLAAVALILFFLILPTVIIIPMSLNESAHLSFPPSGLTFKWYLAYLSDPDWLAATLFSLKIAVCTAVTSTFIGTATALSLVRGDLPFKGFVQAVVISPMIVPHVVLGVALYLVFAPLELTGSLPGFLIGHTVLAVPFVVITVSASLQRLDPALELAAASCGASRIRCFIHVTLPNIAPGIAAGAVFAFLASFDEATVAFFISDIGGKSIGRKMFEDIDFNLTPVIAAASTVIVAASLLLIGIVHLASPSKTSQNNQEKEQ